MNRTGKINVSTIIRGKKAQYQNRPVLKYTCNYPLFSSQIHRVQTERMSAYYRTAAQKFIEYCEKQLLQAAIADYQASIQNNDPVHEYEAILDFTETLNQDCVLSLYTDQYTYTGGAHGSTTRKSDTFSVKQGRRLTLSQLFPGNSQYEQNIIDEILTQISAQINGGEGMYFEDYADLVQSTFNPAQFYLTSDGIVFYFQQYDIAPYASGIPAFEIPYDKLQPTLPVC